MPLGRKTISKVRVVEVPFGGSKRKISSSAPKWAIQVKVLLRVFLKLKKGAFHSLGLVLFDLKRGCGSTFCVVDFALHSAEFCRIPPLSAQKAPAFRPIQP